MKTTNWLKARFYFIGAVVVLTALTLIAWALSRPPAADAVDVDRLIAKAEAVFAASKNGDPITPDQWRQQKSLLETAAAAMRDQPITIKSVGVDIGLAFTELMLFPAGTSPQMDILLGAAEFKLRDLVHDISPAQYSIAKSRIDRVRLLHKQALELPGLLTESNAHFARLGTKNPPSKQEWDAERKRLKSIVNNWSIRSHSTELVTAEFRIGTDAYYRGSYAEALKWYGSAQSRMLSLRQSELGKGIKDVSFYNGQMAEILIMESDCKAQLNDDSTLGTAAKAMQFLENSLHAGTDREYSFRQWYAQKLRRAGRVAEANEQDAKILLLRKPPKN